MNCVLGFDYGARTIGVAVGNLYTDTAHAAGTIKNSPKGPDWLSCDAIFSQWQPDTLLVGLPLTMNGEEQASSRAARAFAAMLEQRYRLPIELVDERLSSVAASERFAQQRSHGQVRRKRAVDIDALAACVIVESWLNLKKSDSTKLVDHE